MVFKKLMKQYSVPWIGAFKETLGAALWWGVPVNFAAVMGTFYYTTVRHVAEWANPFLFFVVLGTGILCLLVWEFKVGNPSIWSWREKQMFSFQSKVIAEMKKMRKQLAAQGKVQNKELKRLEGLIIHQNIKEEK